MSGFRRIYIVVVVDERNNAFNVFEESLFLNCVIALLSTVKSMIPSSLLLHAIVIKSASEFRTLFNLTLAILLFFRISTSVLYFIV